MGKKETNQPLANRTVEYSTHKKEALLQILDTIYIDLDEEEKLNLTEVRSRTRQAFDVDKVTKKFYDKFKKEHSQFLSFIEGITVDFDKEWYAYLMLNRLMFVYFIQKKGFLNNDLNYLKNKLNEIKKVPFSKEETGVSELNFYSFYRYFLLRLFHDGLGSQNRTSELDQLLGKVPYLNGGLFEIHPLENKYPKIYIKDEAFEKIFTFFDQYNWYLDDRPLKSDNEINPDVLGYIFEKYINQKQMGAYYTKEDITEYISKNCIIPYLFDSVKQELLSYYPSDEIDQYLGFYLLSDNFERYIYDAVKKGVNFALPDDIAKGINDVAQRENWNQTADDNYALPTEIWREFIARRKRYFEIKEKLINGEITSINDLITYNLNIRQFAQDAISAINSPLTLKIFSEKLATMSILDPTCGSGAFLFSALNILYPLYDACLERMQTFIDEEKSLKLDAKEKKYIKEFQGILANVRSHINNKYFILKNIILNNLYGVDIMEEATEVCKLRLFLKLASQITPNPNAQNYGIEPLPDIDFNIRSGNSLVGFANYEEVEKAVKGDRQGKLDLYDDMGVINAKAKAVSEVYQTFRSIQTQTDGANFTEIKAKLKENLASLNEELNNYLAKEYGVDIKKKKDYEKWLTSHQPFHWFTEFYSIINNGGFDVIIGNPPYVEYSKVKKDYEIKGYETEKCGNLYAFIMQKTLDITCLNGRFGMIIPVSLGASQRMDILRKTLENNAKNIYYSSFGDRPSCLFLGVHQILSICLIEKSNKSNQLNFYSAGFKHWTSDERNNLFDTQSYIFIENQQIKPNIWGKFNNYLELSILDKIVNENKTLGSYFSSSKNYILAISGGTGGYWLRCFDQSQMSNEYKEKFVSNKEHQLVFSGIINSTIFYWLWRKYSDCRHLTLFDLNNFFFNFKKCLVVDKLATISNSYLDGLKATKEIREGKMTYEQYRSSKVKNLIDEIDKVLAKHYGFSEEELDFIINYDIKYRMGKELDSD
ncbi:Eco57I restriction-modification methylase domain-containing protein [Geminocystis sp. GBBB08]|uniref:Eco57I restriction-modification methylase domain-containing protein n=1 Tax=Geminocystis sp. GBBB08 TaxID=2604140 RepID=UPI0027E26C0E|nr:DNA methyltransferase [Geminocystis sp. GBBB08]